MELLSFELTSHQTKLTVLIDQCNIVEREEKKARFSKLNSDLYFDFFQPNSVNLYKTVFLSSMNNETFNIKT